MCRLRKCMLILLVMMLHIVPACRLVNESMQSETSSSHTTSWSKYYQIDSSSLNEEHGEKSIVTNEGCFILSYYESDEYTDACFRLNEERLLGDTESIIPRDSEGRAVFPEYRLNFYDCNSIMKYSLDLNHILGPTLYSRQIFKDNQNSIWIASIIVDEKNETFSYECSRFSLEGSLTQTICLNSQTSITSLRELCVLQDDTILMLVDSEGTGMCLIFDSKGNQISSCDICMYQPCIEFVDDTPYLIDLDSGVMYSIVDGKLSDKEDFPKEAVDVFSLEGQLFWETSEGLFEFGKNDILLSWEELNMTYAPDSICICENGTIRMISHSFASSRYYQYTLIPSEKNPYEDMKIITIAGIDLLSEKPLLLALEIANEGNTKCHYVIRDYYTDVLGDSSVNVDDQITKVVHDKMRLDVASGTTPDIYFDQCMNLELRDFCKADYLVDLSKYLEGQENEFFYDIMTLQQETPYAICTSYSITCFSVLKNTIEGYSIWDYDAFYDAYSKFDASAYAQGIYTKEELIYNMISMGVSEYVNFETGEVNFHQESFEDLLRWVNDFGCEEAWMSTGYDRLQERMIMLDYEQYNSFGYMLFEKEICPDITSVGYPNTPNQYPYTARNICAISALSPNKDEAWAFIEILLSDSCQRAAMDNPVRIDSLETEMEAYYESFVSESALSASKEELFSEYMKIISQTTVPDNFGSTEIYDIILEESMAYFVGDHTMDETIDLIEERVRIYVNEVI